MLVIRNASQLVCVSQSGERRKDGEAMRSTWVEQWMTTEDRYIADERPNAHAHLVLDGAGTGVNDVIFQVTDGAHGMSAD